MTRFLLLNAVFVVSTFSVFAQLETAWKLYDGQGKSISQKKLTKQMSRAEVVFFGEEHDNAVAHYLSLKLLIDFIEENDQAVFALEMLETDQQEVLNELNAGKIAVGDLTNYTDLWSNFSDYAPMLDTALSLNVPIIASNIPRPWASALFHGGRDSLSQAIGADTALACPIDFEVDITLSQYANLEEMSVHFGDKHFVEAQAVKDATMAKMILQQLEKGNTVFHLNGCYHSDFHQGIVWYLKQQLPKTEVFTISVVTSSTLAWNTEWTNKADVVIVIDGDFPRSY